MPRFAANLSMLYPEHAFLERFAAAAADGFDAVEYLFPYAFQAAELAARLSDLGLTQALFNAPPGDFDAGERGLAGRPERVDDFRRSFLEQALPYAQALACPRLHVMAGLVPAGADKQAHLHTYTNNLAWAAAQAAAHGVAVLIEPINSRDMPGYLLSGQADAHALVRQIGAPNLQVQMDLYHCQIMEGDLAMKLRHYLPASADGKPSRVGHLQIAGVPSRHEPDDGELHYPYLLALIDQLGYSGFVGCEYRPHNTQSGGTSAGLGWLRRWRERAAAGITSQALTR